MTDGLCRVQALSRSRVLERLLGGAPRRIRFRQTIGEAEIVEWRADAPKPDLKTLKKTFNTHADEFNAQQVKAIRRAKLIESDWTQLMDVPEKTRTQRATYRQLLRDLPQQKDFPSQIVWPKPPAG